MEQQSPYQEVDDADKEAIHLYFRNDEGALAAYARACLPASRTRRPPSGASSRWSAGAARRRIMEEAIRVAQEEPDADVITIEAQVQARGSTRARLRADLRTSSTTAASCTSR